MVWKGKWLACGIVVWGLCGGVLGVKAQESKELVARLLERHDKNADGLLEINELSENLQAPARRLDTNGDGSLDAEELGRLDTQGWGNGVGRRPGEENTPPARGERSADILAVGDIAPDFTLPLATGGDSITLSDYIEGKPTVLVFGSLTCPPFRARMLQFDPIFREFGDEVNFLMVYTREAHPESTIYVRRGEEEVLETIEQTDDLFARMDHARICGPTLRFTFPTVVDLEDNAVNRAYAGWPSRLVVVGPDMRIVYDGGPGPRGFQPDALRDWLDEAVGTQ